MKTRKIAGREVYPIGLGAMALDEYDPKPSDEEAVALLKHAVSEGVALIDTADVYGMGRNEDLIGIALTPQQKKSVLIATKAGCTRPGGGWDTNGHPDHLKKAVKESLDRLDVKQIELLQLHAPDSNTPFKDSINALKELQEQDIIKHIGISNVSLDQLKEAEQIVKIVSVQNHFNLARKDDEKDLLPYLTENNIAFLPYFPLGSGQLLSNPKIIELAEKSNCTPAQLALSWILTKWPTAIPIPGTKNKDHLDDNMKAAEIRLDSSTISALDSLY